MPYGPGTYPPGDPRNDPNHPVNRQGRTGIDRASGAPLAGGGYGGPAPGAGSGFSFTGGGLQGPQAPQGPGINPWLTMDPSLAGALMANEGLQRQFGLMPQLGPQTPQDAPGSTIRQQVNPTQGGQRSGVQRQSSGPSVSGGPAAPPPVVDRMPRPGPERNASAAFAMPRGPEFNQAGPNAGGLSNFGAYGRPNTGVPWQMRLAGGGGAANDVPGRSASRLF